MDPIAEMFSQIYNAEQAGHEKVTVPYSKMKMAILEILKKAGKVADFSKIKEKSFEAIEIKLFISQKWQARKISKPGKRIYASGGKIPRPKAYQGLVIVSTNEGLMVGEEARKKGLGGEVVAEVS